MKHVRFIAMVASALLGVQSNAAEYLVKYKDQSTLNQIQRMSATGRSGLVILDTHAPGSYAKVDIVSSQEAATVSELKSNPNVEWVVPNFQLHSFRAPLQANELKAQWAMAKVQAEKAWQRAGNRGNHKITVAVIDTGVDYRHKNLNPNMVPGYDFRDNDSDPMDETQAQNPMTGAGNPGHGTHCAGVIGATGLVEGGIIGLGPELSIMPIRFLGKDGSGDLNGGIKAIDFAIEKGVQVISASWGASVSKANAKALVEAVLRADKAGIIFVAAAANDGKNNDSTDVFPANSGGPNMIIVAATDSSDAKPKWSNYGKATVHVASPGDTIMSTLPGDKYGNLSGTSMATPLVAGLAGLLKSQDSTLTGAQIRALMQTTGAKVNIEVACNCRIDALAAVDQLLSKKPFLVPAAATIDIGSTVNMSVVNGKAPFKFTSNNPSVLTVDEQGVVTAVAKGTTTISMEDSAGVKVSSLDYNIGKVASAPGNPGNPSDPGTPGGECPLGDPMYCEIACQFMPDLPFCAAN